MTCGLLPPGAKRAPTWSCNLQPDPTVHVTRWPPVQLRNQEALDFTQWLSPAFSCPGSRDQLIAGWSPCSRGAFNVACNCRVNKYRAISSSQPRAASLVVITAGDWLGAISEQWLEAWTGSPLKQVLSAPRRARTLISPSSPFTQALRASIGCLGLASPWVHTYIWGSLCFLVGADSS